MAQFAFRLPESLAQSVAKVIREDGYASLSAFMRNAIQNELKRRDQTEAVEEQQTVAASLDAHGKELVTLRSVLQAQFALTDALARMILHCMPEPPAEVHAQALARAKERHDKLLKMTALSMKGNARALLAELINHEE
jgi:Arc/MetJ-type ribon-helix-helix transcriptional regulator